MMKHTLASIDRLYGIRWRFDTARFTVAFWAEDDPNMSSFVPPEDITFASDGGPWFQACVGVFEGEDKGAAELIGLDTLEGCSYNSFREFCTTHRDQDPSNRNTHAMKARGLIICHYFPNMVREAVSEARAELLRRTMIVA